jgi:hypothetical protein
MSTLGNEIWFKVEKATAELLRGSSEKSPTTCGFDAIAATSPLIEIEYPLIVTPSPKNVVHLQGTIRSIERGTVCFVFTDEDIAALPLGDLND